VEVPWRLIKSLYHKKHREETGLTVVEGPEPVTMCLAAKVNIKILVMSDLFAQSPEGERILRQALEANPLPVVHIVSPDVYSRMSEIKSPQGVLCVVPSPFPFAGAKPRGAWKNRLLAVGVDIQDPGNVGTIVRTCASAGADLVVFTGMSSDPFSPKAIRASAGAVFRVGISYGGEPVQRATEFIDSGLKVIKTVPLGGLCPWDVPLTGHVAIFLGNEAKGLRQEILDLPGPQVSIPMPGGTESLNVAAACAMIFYEAVRQRRLSESSL